MQEYLGIILRLAFMYFYALTLVRLTGKRSLGSLSALDFIVTLILGDMFDNVIWGEVPVANGILAIGTTVFMHALLAFLGYAFPAFDRLVLGEYKVTFVEKGRWNREGMQRERLTEEEGWSRLRTKEEDRPEEVQEANVEPSGSIGFLKQDFAKTVQKKDLPALKERIP